MLKTQLKKMVQMSKRIQSGKFKYCCFEEFVLANGKRFKLNSSLVVKRGKQGECFKNAFHLAESGDLIYVEGYATIKQIGFPFSHAWCVNDKNEVVDPTWGDGKEYYGVIFDLDYVRKIILKRGKFGVIDNIEMGFPLLRDKSKINR